MDVQENASLKAYNTFGVDVEARRFVEVNSEADLQAVIPLLSEEENILILGGGSNVLFTKNFEGLVIRMNLGGIYIQEEDDEHVLVKAYSGENWHDFVTWTLQRDFGGLENLSLIPGNVGAAPMQNIGAYGVEVKDTIETVEALEIETGEIITFTNEECEFGYRDSIFKRHAKGKFLITAVTFRLTKEPVLNLEYGAIGSTLDSWGIDEPDIHDVSRAVIYIRQSKLPDPVEIGNGGSFFKNPIIEKDSFKSLQKEYPEMPFYEVESGGGAKGQSYKIPAGWLIEQCGWKGKRVGECGVHEHQALVLVNYGNATGAEIYALAEEIMQSVEDQFGITLQTEVNVY